MGSEIPVIYNVTVASIEKKTVPSASQDEKAK